MTIKINVGVNKKVGLPDYGSAGSHCAIELEADNSLLDNPEQFLQRVKDAYEVARKSVEEELAHHRPGNGNAGQSASRDAAKTENQKLEYRSNNSGSNRFAASAKQQEFIASLVKAVKGLDWHKLDKYCMSKFDKSCSQLSSREASALIEDLKAAKSGGGGLSA